MAAHRREVFFATVKNIHGREVRLNVLTMILLRTVIIGSLPRLGPAYKLSLQRIAELYPQLKVQQSMLVDDSPRDCWDMAANSVRWCDDFPEVYPMTNELDLLTITSVRGMDKFASLASSKGPTWVTLSSQPTPAYIRFYVQLTNMFSWRSLVLVLDISFNGFFNEFWNKLSIEFTMNKDGYQIHAETIDSKAGPINYTELLTRFNAVSRVYFYFGPTLEFRKMMIKAWELNMTNGEHVYIILSTLRPTNKPASGYLTWENRDQFDSVAKLAYRSVLIMEPDDSMYGRTGTDTEHQFYDYMRNHSRMDYNYTYGPFETFSPHISATYNSMLMLAEVIEELRLSGSENVWQSGRQLAKLFTNRTFATDLGEIYMDPTGQRQIIINVNQLDWNTSRIRTVFAQRPGSAKVEIVRKIQWPGVWPPPDEPKCGFRGDAHDCRPHDSMVTIAVSITVTLVAATVAAICTSYVRYGNLLLRLCWEIPSDQLQPVHEIFIVLLKAEV
ncbi:atrial natriuretic peptide receptor 1-like [Paramacrobiotus metropolitanus]|uniref:atrial natriuretic peptide receptor 1-like n=1 Tax=Paramacrobiotus metropolitanus TaxID=2943436 RepID=UPI00244594C2|nr:atrial natriuretic peptide receptor 1-like [Paramacrobiotus metropolitanus]